jgi:hypothetical protein
VPTIRKHEGEADTMIGPFATRQDFNLKKMGSRMLKAARLNGETFRELRDDPSASAQSVALVPIVSLCYGAGLSLFGFFLAGISATAILAFTLTDLLAGIGIGLVWSGTTFLIVTKLFRRTIGYWGLARPFFFSWSPGLLFILMSSPIPTISAIIRVTGTAWIVVASVFAVKHAAEISVQQSMLTFIIGVLVLIVIQSVVPVN